MVSRLLLEVPTSFNPKTFRIFDSSIYNEDITVTCARLEVTPPGFDYPCIIDVEPYFNIVLNVSNLGLARVSKYEDLGDLPDGVYKLRYSIAPNDKVWVEYECLRNQRLLDKWFRAYCRVKLKGCDPTRKQNEDLHTLFLIKQKIDAAKIEVDYCENTDNGMDIYNYASKQLDKFIDGGCKNC